MEQKIITFSKENQVKVGRNLTIVGVTDDMLSAMNSTGIISGYMEVGRVYTGKNILKNHWPIISIIVAILISIVITVTR